MASLMMAAPTIFVMLIVLVAPAFADEFQDFTIGENLPKGTRVGLIGVGFPTALFMPPFQLFGVDPGGCNENFEADDAGVLRTLAPLDRERKAHYACMAKSIATGFPLRLSISVLDANDNSPEFPDDSIDISLSETTPTETSLSLGSASDADAGEFTTQGYEIVDGNIGGAFRLSLQRAPNNGLFMDLVVAKELDRERTSSYRLVVLAFDGGVPRREAKLVVNVDIKDVNDGYPEFTKNEYAVSVRENTPVGAHVLKVSAVDTDSGLNGEVEYSIKRTYQSDRERFFDVDSATGDVVLRRPLDFESKASHSLIVVARDRGEPPLESVAFVRVAVEGVNDNRPVIDLIFLTADHTPKIPEDARPGEYVARVSVTDPDDGGAQTGGGAKWSNVSVALEGGAGAFDLKDSDSVIYLILVSSPLDREKQPFYSLKLVAADSGTPPLVTERNFTVEILDVNDSPPTFAESVYETTLLEAVSPEAVVVRVEAQDADEGVNARVTYALTAEDPWFKINAETGLITTKAKIDCDTNPHPELLVVATDGGTPALSSTATVLINIKDEETNPPTFPISFYNFSVPESAPIGKCFAGVVAADPDCGINARLHYAIPDPADAPKARKSLDIPEASRDFAVHMLTGKICVARGLDRERKAVYEFPVVASDVEGMTASAMVRIQLVDINDNRPKFQSPATLSTSLPVASARTGTQVALVRADDPDAGWFGAVRYSILKGNSEGVFSIEEDSGRITLAMIPGNAEGRRYTLTIQARDKGGQVSDPDLTLEVFFSPLSESLIFTKPLYEFSLNEDAVVGATVGEVAVTGAAAASVDYVFVSGNERGFFRLDARTGSLTTAKNIDCDDPEIGSQHLLGVKAVQKGTSRTGMCQISVTVQDVNDESPVFASGDAFAITLLETDDLKKPVYVAEATDRDRNYNGAVRYRLIGDEAVSLFSLGAIDGALRPLTPLDYEARKSFAVEIEAYDLGTPTRSAMMTVNIELQDVNDNAPTFEKQVMDVYLSEATHPNTQFLKMLASDADEGVNRRISFELSTDPPADPESTSLFGVFPNTGFLYVRRKLNADRLERVVILVVATDAGTPAKSSTATVVVNVQRANYNDPVFDYREYDFFVEENLPAGQVVGTVQATDLDPTDPNNILTYAIVPDDGTFHVDPSTGLITTRSPLDRETKDLHELIAHVFDHGREQSRSDQARVRIHVEDANDNAPEFVGDDQFLARVKEEQDAGLLVTQLYAQDPDAGENASITYHFVASDGMNDLTSFSLDPKTGVVTTKRPLDYEARRSYLLTVVSRDAGRPRPMESPARLVRVVVDDINDNQPIFVDYKQELSVSEDTPPGSEVGRVLASDRDTGANGRVSYLLVGGNTFGCFGLNATTGAIYVARPLDRELNASHTLTIRAIDSSGINPRSTLVRLVISVEDVNDVSPVFKEDPVIFSLAENAQVGSIVWTFTATDADAGANGRVTFSIEQQAPGANVFSINAVTGELALSNPLDYETFKNYTLIVVAEDGAEPPEERRQSTLTALVIVVDVNDNEPVFDTRSRVDIMEDEPVGFPVLHVIANDEDSHLNGDVTYAIAGGNSGRQFAIDPVSGLVTLVKPLDFESDANFLLNVTATDHGTPRPLTSWMTVTVHLADVNDHSPAFEMKVYTAAVDENEPEGTFVVKVKATDRDQGVNGELSYDLPLGIAEDKFRVDSRTGLISTTGPLDREAKSRYVLTVYVSDGAFPSRHDSAVVNVKVLDRNDGVPRFSEDRRVVSVPENVAAMHVHAILAVDQDEGENGRVSYSIEDGDVDGKFSLDSDTGVLSCRPLDRETRETYHLVVVARDHGSDPPLGPNSASATVVVNVADRNDNDPRFSQSSYAATLRENDPVGTVVVRVLATDADKGNNSVVSYSLDNGTSSLFRVDPGTGVITTAGPFDREKKDRYTFQVLATDGALYDNRTERAGVTVLVSDVNDNAPVFKEVPYIATISADAMPATPVIQVVAEDKDTGSNGIVYYSLADHTDKFSVEASSGEIRTSARLLGEADALYRLTVVAHDRGSPSQSATGFVEVRTSSTQVASLHFENSTYTVYIKEHSAVDTVITKVRASRPTGPTSPVQYSFASGNEDSVFKIGVDSGVVAVARPAKLDYESNPRLRLIVIAQAEGREGGGAIYGYATVWVNLRDVNDHEPIFSQEKYSSATWEGVPPGRYVVQVHATDADGSAANSQIEYYIVDGNYDDAFTIDPAFSGIVKTNIKLDRETYSAYRLTIRAVDSGHPSRSSTALLRISVVDVNDNEPRFPPPQIVDVPESRAVGSVVATVAATDVDATTEGGRAPRSGTRGTPGLTYFFAQGGDADGAFAVDETSGAVVLAKPLDFERRREYVLSVKASDSLHEARTTLTVRVVDENDNAPVFRRRSYSATLPEKTPAGYRVVQVRADDADSGVNAEISYSLGVTPTKGFYVDAATGVIFTNATVRYDPADPTVQLVVTARDGGPPPGLAAVAAVKIHVTDASDAAPRFREHIYASRVAEDAEKGTLVTEVEALHVVGPRDGRNLDYAILAGNEDREFRVISGVGTKAEIITVRALDRERTATYNLRVLAVDRTAPAKRNATAEVVVTVTDVNDNSPQFFKPIYEASVKENQPPGTPVVTVSASDADAGANARLRYDITSGNDADSFAVNAATGVITVARALDADVKNEYRFIVRVSDDALPPERRLSALTTVRVSIGDVNDNKPTFPVLMYLEAVEENAAVGTAVFTAHANDRDAGPFGRLTYSITEGSGKEVFRINKDTGEVTTTAVFDYEAETSYLLTVMAVDGDNWATVRAQISILSVDEFEPKFERQSYRYPAFPSTAQRGTVVGRVGATDADGGEDGVVVYTIRTKQENVAINASTGEIFIVKPFVDREARRRRSVAADHEGDDGHPETPVMLLIMASSGKENSKSDVAIAKLAVDYTCPGCAPLSSGHGGSGSDGDSVMRPTIIVVAVLVVVVVALVVVVVVLRIRTKRKGARQAALVHGSLRQSGDGRGAVIGGNNPLMMGGHPPFVGPFAGPAVHDQIPPPYLGVHAYGANLLGPGFSDLPSFAHPRANLSTSEISEVSRGSATSSGRGSAEDDEIDRICRQSEGGGHDTTRSREERMRLVREHMHDSGVHPGRDGDGASISDVSSASLGAHGVRSTEEYLARLGISPSRQKALAASGHARSVESMFAFSDEGGGEGLDLQADLDHLVYAKIPDFDQSARGSVINGLGPRSGGEDLASILGSSCATPSATSTRGRGVPLIGSGAATAVGSVGSHLDRHGGSGAGSSALGGYGEDDLLNGIAYNWDHLLDWTPSFLPLAPVFAEIAKLKEEDDDDDTDDDDEDEEEEDDDAPQPPNFSNQSMRPSSWQPRSTPAFGGAASVPPSLDHPLRPPPMLTGAAPRIPPPPNMASHPLNSHVQLLPQAGGGGLHRPAPSAIHRLPFHHSPGNPFHTAGAPHRGSGGSHSPLSVESVYSATGFSGPPSMAALSAPQSPSPLLTPVTPAALTPRAPSATSVSSRSSDRGRNRQHRRSGGAPPTRRGGGGLSDNEMRL